MENNIVQFITENIFLFLPIGIIGIATTLYLYVTASREGTEKKDDLQSDYIPFFRFTLNFYVLIYIFIFIMMVIMGFLSNFIEPVIVGGIFALIPILSLLIVKIRHTHLKEL